MVSSPVNLTLLLTGLFACMATIETEIFSYDLGETTMEVVRTKYEGPSNLTIVHLHDNEITARKAAAKVLQTTGGALITLRNNDNRLLRFTHQQQRYAADPNRIFTPEGRQHTLAMRSEDDEEAADILSGFANYLIGLLPANRTVVSMHNNTDRAYSVLSYRGGGELHSDAEAVHVVPSRDVDDFFLTTSSPIYARLKEKNFNVVLQDNDRVRDDGSLSVYFGQQRLDYVNIEAQHGHSEQQITMLRILQEIVE